MRVLFIGNSHTYFNDMPYIFKKICEENGIKNIEVTMLARGYKGLDYHLKEPQTRFNILYGNYNYIILQHLQSGFNKNVLLTSVEKLKNIIDNTASKVILYMTWTLKSEREKQLEMTSGYLEVGKKLGIKVAPVGIIWWKFFDKFPNKELYFEDNKHASPLGSHLAAYTIYDTIFNKTAKSNIQDYIEINKIIEEINYKNLL